MQVRLSFGVHFCCGSQIAERRLVGRKPESQCSIHRSPGAISPVRHGDGDIVPCSGLDKGKQVSATIKQCFLVLEPDTKSNLTRSTGETQTQTVN